jgi:hypothetical protein
VISCSDPIRAADVIEFIERFCFIPEGQHVGNKLELQAWQKDWLRTVYDNPHGPRYPLDGAQECKNDADCMSVARAFVRPAGP